MTDPDCAILIARHGPAMLLYARQFAPSLADAEDIVQDAFLRAFRRPPQATDAAVHLFTCVRSVALDQLRANRRRERRESSVAREAPLLVSPDSDRHEFREAVEASLSRLPAEQSEVLVLKIWGGLTFEQIGAALHVPPNTAASRYRSACELLRRLLNKEVFK